MTLLEGRPTLFVPTNSIDGSADVLAHLCRVQEVGLFRWNIDLWDSYEVDIRHSCFLFRDPTGRQVDILDPSTLVLLRKPILQTVDWPEARVDKKVFDGQLIAVIHALTGIASEHGRLRLVEPRASSRLSKLRQLTDAMRWFNVPEYQFSVHGPSSLSPPLIAKPLSEMELGGGKAFYTTRVDADELERPFPWFLQAAVIGGVDLTCVFIGGSMWFFKSSYHRGERAVDWRLTINTESRVGWQPYDPPGSESLREAVRKVMNHWGLHYGRLDFIEDSEGTVWFLECNPNGQFGFLDDESLYLHRAFLDGALSAGSAVRIH